ncbi:MAG: AIPR family protein [Rhodobacteraceae bacterium]|nr:AIPR family protein [Paracoccaceae bacterium]
MTIEEFAEMFRQDVLAEADANGQFVEDIFFEKACAHLMEEGDLDTADRASYWHPTRGIRIDGSGGDPLDSSGTLHLLGLDFKAEHTTGRLTGSEMGAVFKRMERFVKFALDDKWRNSLEETSPAFGLADMVASRWKRIRKVRLILISNRQLSDRVDGRPAAKLEGKQATYNVWDLKRLYHADTSSEPEVLDIDLESDFGGAIDVLPAQRNSDAHESYLAVIPASVLAEIYDRWGPRLLEQNVRVFLQARSKVNRGIRNTLYNVPSMFFAYNNGITATAHEVDIRNKHGGLSLRKITNFQIVNGGQTTGSIHSAMLKGKELSQVFIQMKLSVVDSSRATEVVPKISEYANSQNRIAASDFFANHPFHVRVENFSRRIFAPSPDGSFQQSKWFYERARGQYADARAQRTVVQRRRFDIEYPRRQRFTKTDLAKFLNVWNERPHEVSKGAQKNFAAFSRRVGEKWKKSSDSFNEDWYCEAIAKAIVFKSTERIVSAQPWYKGGFRANIVAYTIARISSHVKDSDSAVNFDSIWRRQALGEGLRETIAVVAERINSVLCHPPEEMRNITEWAKKQACWEQARNINVEWPHELNDELVTVGAEKEKKHQAKVQQQMLTGIEAQLRVHKAGKPFWADALAWGRKKGLLSPKDIGVLGWVSNESKPPSSEKQSVVALTALAKLCDEGYPKKLP